VLAARGESGVWGWSSPVDGASVAAEVVAFYGHPGVRAMGVLGHGTPTEVAEDISAWVEHYDRLNGPLGAIGAYHLITGVAQANPTSDGTWIYRLSHDRLATYVEAAQVVGSSNFRIMWRHIAPNMFGLMIVITSISLPAAILAEASLSFLGLGVPIGGLDAVPSWGADLSGSSRRFFSVAPWLAVFPGLALAITVFGFNIFGDSLRDTLDPRLRGRI